MRKFKTSIASLLLFLTILNITSCSTIITNRNNLNNSNDTTTNSNDKKISEIESSLDKLANAKSITIKKDLISLNKSYSIQVDDEDFGSVSGKYVNITGNKFILKDKNDNTLLYEKQIKRWGTTLNRISEIYNHNNEIIGYIGEEKEEDIFKLFFTFHLFDENKNEKAVSNQKIFLSIDTFEIYDINENLCFEVNAQFSLFSDKYVITVYDNSTISSGEAILLTTSLNSIKNRK